MIRPMFIKDDIVVCIRPDARSKALAGRLTIDKTYTVVKSMPTMGVVQIDGCTFWWNADRFKLKQTHFDEELFEI